MHGQTLANQQLMKVFQLASISVTNYAFKADRPPFPATRNEKA